MYKFKGVTESHVFDMTESPPKDKSIFAKLVLVTVVATILCVIGLSCFSSEYLLLMQERLAGGKKVAASDLDLFSASGIFNGIQTVFTSGMNGTAQTAGQSSNYSVGYGKLPEDYVLSFAGDHGKKFFTAQWNSAIDCGCTAEATAAMIGSAAYEGNIDSYSGAGVGIYQFVGGAISGYRSYCSSASHANHHKINGCCAEAACQTKYFISHPSNGYINWLEYKDTHLSVNFKSGYEFVRSGDASKAAITFPDKNVSVPKTITEFLKCDDIKMASLAFYVNKERAAAAAIYIEARGHYSSAASAYHGNTEKEKRKDLFWHYRSEGSFHNRCKAALAAYKKATKVAEKLAGSSIASNNSANATASLVSGWKYLDGSHGGFTPDKCCIDESTLSPERQKVIDRMFWIVWNSWYTQGVGDNGHMRSLDRDTNWNVIKRKIDAGKDVGTDCSGSIYAAYTSIGITVPSGTGLYPGEGKWINKKDLVAGDVLATHGKGHVLMFLGWANKSKTRIYAAQMHGCDDNYGSFKKGGNKPEGSVKEVDYPNDMRPWQILPPGTGIPSSSSSSSTSTVTQAVPNAGSVAPAANTNPLHDTTLIAGNQLVVSAYKSNNLKAKKTRGKRHVDGKYYEGCFFLAQDHTGYNYLKKNKHTIKRALQKGTTLVVLTGTDDTGRAPNIASLSNKFGAYGSVYVCTLPPVDSECRTVNNQNIEHFNTTIKSSAVSYKVLDLHSFCSSNDVVSEKGSSQYSLANAGKILKEIRTKATPYEHAAIASNGQSLNEALSQSDSASAIQQSTTNFSGNDGLPRSDIYGDCGIESSYVYASSGKDVPYYDVAVPYKVTCEDIGGVADDVETNTATYTYTAYGFKGGRKFKPPYCANRVGCKFTQEKASINTDVIKFSAPKSTEGGIGVFAACGTKQYAIALGKWCYPRNMVRLGFHGFGSISSTGVLCDLIMTDGSIIHCTTGDAIGYAHSNQVGQFDGWTAASKASAQDHTRYHTTAMKFPAYQYMFHAAACHVIEFFGNPSAFEHQYGIKENGTGNCVAFIRMYKANLAHDQGKVKAKDKFKNITTKVQ